MTSKIIKPLDGRYFSKAELNNRLKLMNIDFSEHLLQTKSNYADVYNQYVYDNKYNFYIRHLFKTDKESFIKGKKRQIQTTCKSKSKEKDDRLTLHEHITKKDLNKNLFSIEKNKTNVPKQNLKSKNKSKERKTTIEMLDQLLESNVKKNNNAPVIETNSDRKIKITHNTIKLFNNSELNQNQFLSQGKSAQRTNNINEVINQSPFKIIQEYPNLNMNNVKKKENEVIKLIDNRLKLYNEANYKFSAEFWLKSLFSIAALGALAYYLYQKSNVQDLEELLKTFNISVQDNKLIIFFGIGIFLCIFVSANMVHNQKYIELAKDDYNKLVELSHEAEFPNKEEFCLREDKIISKFSKERNYSEEAYIKLIFPELKKIILLENRFNLEEHNEDLYLRLK